MLPVRLYDFVSFETYPVQTGRPARLNSRFVLVVYGTDPR